jgi:D-lactate dehydrogenase
MLGGILSNNSSGMCCGVAQNAYHTLESLSFLMPSGTFIDTADPEADAVFSQREPSRVGRAARFAAAHPVAARAVRPHQVEVPHEEHDRLLAERLLDFDRPVDILRHLLVGSEGTLAFIAEAVLRTVRTCR